MRTLPLIIISLLVNLAAFIAFPETGRMGTTFLYVSAVLWTAFAFLLGSRLPYGAAARALQAAFFILACAFSALSFLPQKDGFSPLRKLSDGRYPDGRSLFLGLLRLGIDCPSLLPPQKEEILP
jgi:hypothetical protein